MKNLTYTFFYGYLSLKWKRLFRTILVLLYFFLIQELLNKYSKSYDLIDISTYFLKYFMAPPILIALSSWVVQPFIVCPLIISLSFSLSLVSLSLTRLPLSFSQFLFLYPISISMRCDAPAASGRIDGPASRPALASPPAAPASTCARKLRREEERERGWI